MRLLDAFLLLIAATAMILALAQPDFLPAAWYWRVGLLAGGLLLAI